MTPERAPPCPESPAIYVMKDGLRWSPAGVSGVSRLVAEETAVAIVHDASTTAVLMASPADLEDLAVGFSLTEGIVDTVDALSGLQVLSQGGGLECRLWLAPGEGARLAERRRRLVGPTGCGLCGVDSLAQAIRPIPRIEHPFVVDAVDMLAAMASLAQAQVIGQATRATHAAGFWRHGEIVAVREDVGRHNALDKLIGALARQGTPPAGLLLLTSRVSVEMVQKAAMFGAPILCAVSAPTALALRTADAAGITLAAVCRADGFEVFTHPDRIRR